MYVCVCVYMYNILHYTIYIIYVCVVLLYNVCLYIWYCLGTFCKDQVYLEGALQLLKRRRCLDFHLLVRLGKVAHGDIERLVEHFQVEGTRIPSFMEDLPLYRQQLNHIADSNGLTDSLLADVEWFLNVTLEVPLNGEQLLDVLAEKKSNDRHGSKRWMKRVKLACYVRDC